MVLALALDLGLGLASVLEARPTGHWQKRRLAATFIRSCARAAHSFLIIILAQASLFKSPSLLFLPFSSLRTPACCFACPFAFLSPVPALSHALTEHKVRHQSSWPRAQPRHTANPATRHRKGWWWWWLGQPLHRRVMPNGSVGHSSIPGGTSSRCQPDTLAHALVHALVLARAFLAGCTGLERQL